jgi:hypothetical protein
MFTAVAAAVLASLLTAFLLKAARLGQEVTNHDRAILERSQDLRRWIRDSERRRLARLAEITGDNNERNTLRSGGHQGGIKIASEIFREEWRNEASSVLRDFWGVADSEGRLHELVRRRVGSYPSLILPQDVRDLLAKWRGPVPVPGMDPVVLDDPAGMDPEPEVAGFERDGSVEFPRRHLLSGSYRPIPPPGNGSGA